MKSFSEEGRRNGKQIFFKKKKKKWGANEAKRKTKGGGGGGGEWIKTIEGQQRIDNFGGPHRVREKPRKMKMKYF